MEGKKGTGAEADYPLRPEMTEEAMRAGDAELMEHIADLAALRKKTKALTNGSYTNVKEGNEQLLFAREYGGETWLCALNIADHPAVIEADWKGSHLSVPLEAFGSRIFPL